MILVLMFSIFAGATIVAFSLRAIYSIGIISIRKGIYLTLFFALIVNIYASCIFVCLANYETFITNPWTLASIGISAIIIPTIIVGYVAYNTAITRSSNKSKYETIVAKLSKCKIKNEINNYLIFYFEEEQIDRVIKRIRGRKDA
jgi:hypothetical protein